MKIWFISDTHQRHAELDVPDVDVVIHCGDEANIRTPELNEAESRSFFSWFSALPVATKIFVPGNHSTAVEEGLVKREDYPQVHFLIHQAMKLGELNVFGTPWTPMFFAWAYNKLREDLDAIWATIPDNIDILVTHGPPKGILDVTGDWRTKKPVHIGSKSLTRHVETRIQPQIHAFGHLHDERGIRNYGTVTRGKTQFINCSCVNLQGDLVHHGMVIEIHEEWKANGN